MGWSPTISFWEETAKQLISDDFWGKPPKHKTRNCLTWWEVFDYRSNSSTNQSSFVTGDPMSILAGEISTVIRCAPRTAQRNQDPDLVSVYPAGTAGLRSLDSCSKGVSWNGRSPSHHGCHGRMTWVIWGYCDFRKPPFFRSPFLIGKSSVNGPFSITMLYSLLEGLWYDIPSGNQTWQWKTLYTWRFEWDIPLLCLIAGGYIGCSKNWFWKE